MEDWVLQIFYYPKNQYDELDQEIEQTVGGTIGASGFGLGERELSFYAKTSKEIGGLEQNLIKSGSKELLSKLTWHVCRLLGI